MKHGRGGGQAPWEGQQQYPPWEGQQYPQDQPWQPEPYDVAAHQRRIQDPAREQTWQLGDWQLGNGRQHLQDQPWQPDYGPPRYRPEPPQRGKSWALRHKLLSGLIVVAALVVIGVVASASGSNPSSSVPSTIPAKAAGQPSAAGPVSPAAVTPRTVASFSGSGQVNTASFTVSRTWKLTYTYDCSAFGMKGNFAVLEDGGSDFNGVVVNDLGMGKTATSWAYNDAGTHYLEIESECAWKVKVIDVG